MIPIGDDNPTKGTPFVTITLIIVNTLFFLWDHVYAPHALAAFTMVPCTLLDVCQEHTVQTVSPPVITIFTSMFLHGGWMHLLGNMLFLWIFGNNVEDVLGHFRFAALYLFWGVVAALFHTATSIHSPIPTLGASGAIAGVLGAYALLFPRSRVRILLFTFIITVISVPAAIVLGLWFAYQLLMPQPGVAVWAHVGGFIAGLLTVMMLGKSKLLRAYYRKERYETYFR